MDYWPNVEAVKWFCEYVLDAVRKQEPNFLFCIVGMKPTDEVKKLGNLPGVRVTGAVPDVRPYLSHALAACLPLQLARGIQNKALEAMSMTLPVLATQDALLGIVDFPGVLSIVANDAETMTAAALEILARPRQTNSAGRACVLEHYNWDTNLRRMEAFSGQRWRKPVMHVLHVLDHSIPLQSGYTFRTRAILEEQRALGWQTTQLTGPKHNQGKAGAGDRGGRWTTVLSLSGGRGVFCQFTRNRTVVGYTRAHQTPDRSSARGAS